MSNFSMFSTSTSTTSNSQYKKTPNEIINQDKIKETSLNYDMNKMQNINFNSSKNNQSTLSKTQNSNSNTANNIDMNNLDFSSHNFFGTLNNKYILIKKIGEGGTSKVYLAKSLLTSEIFAIKIIKASQESEIKLVENEINILKEANNPNIVKIIEGGQGVLTNNQGKKSFLQYLVLEYVKYGELFNFIFFPQQGFGEKIGKFIFLEMLKGLLNCHLKGIIHRDIKTENIMINENFELKISDFGFSTKPLVSKNNGLLVTQKGTPNYAAPEINENRPYYGVQADIFSLGVCLFVIVTGKMPFKRAVFKDLHYKLIIEQNYEAYWEKIESILIPISNEFKELFETMISYDPCLRPSLEEIVYSNWLKNTDTIASKEEYFLDMNKRLDIINKNSDTKEFDTNYRGNEINIEVKKQVISDKVNENGNNQYMVYRSGNKDKEIYMISIKEDNEENNANNKDITNNKVKDNKDSKEEEDRFVKSGYLKSGSKYSFDNADIAIDCSSCRNTNKTEVFDNIDNAKNKENKEIEKTNNCFKDDCSNNSNSIHNLCSYLNNLLINKNTANEIEISKIPTIKNLRLRDYTTPDTQVESIEEEGDNGNNNHANEVIPNNKEINILNPYAIFIETKTDNSHKSSNNNSEEDYFKQASYLLDSIYNIILNRKLLYKSMKKNSNNNNKCNINYTSNVDKIEDSFKIRKYKNKYKILLSYKANVDIILNEEDNKSNDKENGKGKENDNDCLNIGGIKDCSKDNEDIDISIIENLDFTIEIKRSKNIFVVDFKRRRGNKFDFFNEYSKIKKLVLKERLFQ